MKPGLWIIFLLISILPVAILAWLGLSLSRDEQKILENRYGEIIRQKLEIISKSAEMFLKNEEKELLETLSVIREDREAVRKYLRKSPKISNVFILDENGLPVLPSASWEDISPREKNFIERSRNALVHIHQQMKFMDNESDLKIASDQKGSLSPYFWNNQIYLVCSIRSGMKIKGVELNWMNFLSRFLGILPVTDPDLQENREFRISLNDSSGKSIYQWGTYPAKKNSSPVSKLLLPYPLNSMELVYYGEKTLPGRSYVFNFVAGMIFLILLISGMAYYFYRENTRDLREAEQRMTFVNLVSHELKTPLTNIRMYAELLEEHLSDDELAGKHLAVLVSESRRLSRLIENVLAFSRKERNKLKIRRKPGSVREAVRKILAQFSISLHEKGIAVDFKSEDERTVDFDEDIVQQIIGNLIGNVEKYAASGKWLGIAHTTDNGMTVITVSDKGDGIPADKKELIFEPFYRISGKLTDGVAGTGIGLTISRALARLHGGDLVLLDSEKGAVFQLRIK